MFVYLVRILVDPLLANDCISECSLFWARLVYLANKASMPRQPGKVFDQRGKGKSELQDKNIHIYNFPGQIGGN